MYDVPELGKNIIDIKDGDTFFSLDSEEKWNAVRGSVSFCLLVIISWLICISQWFKIQTLQDDSNNEPGEDDDNSTIFSINEEDHVLKEQGKSIPNTSFLSAL